MHNFIVHPFMAQAHTISTDVYKSPGVFEMAKEKIFAHSWQFAGDTDMLSISGACHPFTLLEKYLDEPLLLTRDATGRCIAFPMYAPTPATCWSMKMAQYLNLLCRYHGRLFYLDGMFRSMPVFKKVKDFPTNSDNLTKLPLFQWGKFLFTSLQPQFDAGLFLKI